MHVRLNKSYGFFVVRGDGVQHLGETWPAGAVFSASKRRAVVVSARDRVKLHDGHGVDDALELARRDVADGASKAAVVGRHVGTFGRMNLYERVFDVTADDAAPILFCTTKECKDERERKTVHLKITKAAKTRRIEGYASTPVVDRSQDIVEPTAFAESMPTFMANPVMLWNHDMSRPIGKVVDFAIKAEGLWIAGEITDNQVWDWIDSDTVRALSASFLIQDRKIEQVAGPEGEFPMVIRRVTKAELIEVSVVTIPDNRTTLFSVAKALSAGDDVHCCGCESAARECACAETRSVVEHRAFAAAKAGAIDFRREAIVELGGVGLEALCGLIEKNGANPMRHHGVQGGDVVTSPEAVRCGIAALVSCADMGTPLSEAERMAGLRHLSKHAVELGVVTGLDGEDVKGPRPELAAKALGKSERGEWAICFSTATHASPQAQADWLEAHGFAGLPERGEDVAWKRYGAAGSVLLERHWLDNGVSAALYLASTSGEPVTVLQKNVQGDPAPAAPAAPTPAPAPAATQSAATPAANKASEQPAATEDLVEVDTDDPAFIALDRAHAAAKRGDAVDPNDVKQAMTLFEDDGSQPS